MGSLEAIGGEIASIFGHRMTEAPRLSNRLFPQTFSRGRRLSAREEVGEGSGIFSKKVSYASGYVPCEDLLIFELSLLLSPMAIEEGK